MSLMAYREPDLARYVAEPVKPADAGGGLGRGPFQRDRARVLHSAALRRLAAKTQVVGIGQDDFPRTRLTHSLECAQIGRELGSALGCDADLVDAACLAHDLGHPPFGHNGELALDLAAAGCGGFEGNAQSLRVLTRLEAKVDGAGLNLTRATLDAAIKYPWIRRTGTSKFGVYADDLPVFDWVRAGVPDGRRCLEAQVMDWADDIAYSVHDLEDGVYAGHIPLDRLDADVVVETASTLYCELPTELLRVTFAELTAQAWWLPAYDGTTASQVGLKRLTSTLIGRFCTAALRATSCGPAPLARYSTDLVVPEAARAECALLKAVSAHYVMGRAVQRAVQAEERELMAELVAALLARAPDALEPALQAAYHVAPNDAGRLRTVVDQVASLTDTSARAWHARLAAASQTMDVKNVP